MMTLRHFRVLSTRRAAGGLLTDSVAAQLWRMSAPRQPSSLVSSPSSSVFSAEVETAAKPSSSSDTSTCQ